MKKKKNTHTHKQKTKQGNLYNLDNNRLVSAVTPTIMQPEIK
jgi:hypothetical protein